MKIIIVGCGKVGEATAKHLSGEGHDIVLVDKNSEKIRYMGDKLDIMCVKGSGLRTSVLLDAGVAECDLLIAATSSDEVNMLCCLTGKRLGAKHTIARIRDPEYSEELTTLKKEMGLDMVINPEQEAAAEIARVLRFPTAINVETFVDGKVEMVSFRVRNDGFMNGQSLSQIMSKIKMSLIFCAVVHNGEVIIPDGNYVACADDLFYVIGEPAEIYNFFKFLKRDTSSSKTALVIGGGRIAYYLCRFLADVNIQVKLIEIDRDRCYEMNEILPNCVIINGDGSDYELLDEEDISSFSSVVTITGRDEENLLTALYATRAGVPKVVAKINRASYDEIIESFGIDSVISPKNLTAVQIVGFVRALNNSIDYANIEALYHIVDGKAEALEFLATDRTHNLGIPFKDIKFKKNFIVAAIERNGKVIIPSGNDFILSGDSVVMICSNTRAMTLNDVFENGGR
ncbi:MAG: Trk system potassium transporter TrkA [Clostridiales bacterium]|nr:Trk system potassium transporter TrkA [Clostridiales bacterium]